MENQDNQQPPPVLDYKSPTSGSKEADRFLATISMCAGLLATLCAIGGVRFGVVALAHLGLLYGVLALIEAGPRRLAVIGTSLNGLYCLIFWTWLMFFPISL